MGEAGNGQAGYAARERVCVDSGRRFQCWVDPFLPLAVAPVAVAASGRVIPRPSSKPSTLARSSLSNASGKHGSFHTSALTL